MKIEVTDRLRLDVKASAGNEIDSWAGGSRFEEGNVAKFVSGPFGTGPFGTFLSDIFTLAGVTFKTRDHRGQRRFVANLRDPEAWRRSRGFAGSCFGAARTRQGGSASTARPIAIRCQFRFYERCKTLCRAARLRNQVDYRPGKSLTRIYRLSTPHSA
ncbi:MAG: hypothetical protein ACR2I2_12175 [Bryobacteraceae bacterium]